MIISVLIDMLQTNLRQLGWAYFLFADRCRTDNWRCVIEQKYLSWQLCEQDKMDLSGSQKAWDYTFSMDLSSVQGKVAVIPQGIFDQCHDQYGALSTYHLLTHSWKPLEDYLENLFDCYEEQGSIEGIVIYPKAPFSVRHVAEARGIPLFVLEVAPMRWPIYTGGAYFSHFDQLSSDPGECQRLYQEFQEVWKKKQLPLLTREQILAIYLEKEYMPYLRYLYVQPDSETLLIGNGINGKADLPMNWDHTKILADCIRKRFGDAARFRPDGRDPFEAHFGMSDAQYSQENPNIVSILRCKRCVSAGSNMMFEAMLWGRPVYCDTKDHGLYFVCNHTSSWEDFQAPDDFLNFYAFVYIAPMDIATMDDYVRWRLTEPTMEDIYWKHLNHYLGRWGLNAEQILTKSTIETVNMIAVAKGVSEPCFPLTYPQKTEITWELVRQELGYSLGPMAERLFAHEQKERELVSVRDHLDISRRELEDVQRELENTQRELGNTQKELGDVQGKLDDTQKELDTLRCSNQELIAEKAILSEVNVRITSENRQITDKNQVLSSSNEELSETVQTFERQNAELIQSLQEKTNRSLELEAQLDTFFHSRSWKITSPLRWVMNLLRNLRNRLFGDYNNL